MDSTKLYLARDATFAGYNPADSVEPVAVGLIGCVTQGGVYDITDGATDDTTRDALDDATRDALDCAARDVRISHGLKYA